LTRLRGGFSSLTHSIFYARKKRSARFTRISTAINTLQIFWSDTGVLGDARNHSGADFFTVVKREDDIRPPLAGQGAVRTGLPLDFPPEAKQC
jgi:hypothetical protein